MIIRYFIIFIIPLEDLYGNLDINDIQTYLSDWLIS